MSKTIFIFAELGHMPSWLTMLPRRIPNGTPKMHFFGFSFHWYSLRDLKVCSRLWIRV